MKTLNELYSSLATQRRYEVWFVRMGLADDGGAWWFRYLLMNPGRRGCAEDPRGMPVQVWATWFPRDGKPQSFIQGFPLEEVDLSARGRGPFHFRAGKNEIGEGFCQGELEVDGHSIAWDLQYRSTFRVTLSNKGWIGFSRTPHSDALFSGTIQLDGRKFAGNPLGFGVQGHNCGYRHRKFWTWGHACFARPDAPPSSCEALIYEMPFGLVFGKAVLWHDGRAHVFRNVQELRRDAVELRWEFRCSTKAGLRLEGTFSGNGPSIHRLPYVKTDCRGNFEVANNSLARAVLRLEEGDGRVETLETNMGAVLEMAGG
jgi:hypothetical protein